jgi:hypothetical protein
MKDNEKTPVMPFSPKVCMVGLAALVAPVRVWGGLLPPATHMPRPSFPSVGLEPGQKPQAWGAWASQGA